MTPAPTPAPTPALRFTDSLYLFFFFVFLDWQPLLKYFLCKSCGCIVDIMVPLACLFFLSEVFHDIQYCS